MAGSNNDSIIFLFGIVASLIWVALLCGTVSALIPNDRFSTIPYWFVGYTLTLAAVWLYLFIKRKQEYEKKEKYEEPQVIWSAFKWSIKTTLDSWKNMGEALREDSPVSQKLIRILKNAATFFFGLLFYLVLLTVIVIMVASDLLS